jgi:hypothetical protein
MADNPKPLSQDDIDSLIGEISGPAPGAAKADNSAPSAAAAALIGQAKDASHVPTAIGQTPHGQGQDEAEHLLNQVQEVNEQPITPAPIAKGAHTTKSLSQSEIDALINQVQDAGEKPTTGPQPKSTALTKSMSSQGAAVKTAQLTKSLRQEEIDSLINQVQDAGEKPSTAPVNKGSSPLTKVTPTAALDKGNRGIDRLLASVETQAQQKAQTQLAGSAAAQDVSGSGPLGQDDIDRLLAELGAAVPAKPGAATPRGTTGRTVKGTERAANGPNTAPTTMPGSERGAKPIPTTSKTAVKTAKVATAATAAAGQAAQTVALSAADLEALVTKQAGIESDHSEAPMIDQGDIDALVKQLATATGAPDTKRISDALAQHEGEIDKLLEKAADANATMDAVEVTRSTPANGARAVVSGAPTMSVMPAGELRGARWLLAAAVLFLGVCSATLMIVVNAINSLSHELHEGHHAALAPSDSFGDDLKAALSKLGAEDDGEVTKGVLFLQRLKVRHPSHLADIALTLARHFRSHGAHRQAVEEFAALSDNANGPFDDPRIYLDYANSLVQLGDQANATRQIYLLLANEDAYLGEHDRRGLARPADEIGRNRQAVQDAYLALGQLIVGAGAPEAAITGPPKEDHHASGEPAARPAAGALGQPAAGPLAAPPAMPAGDTALGAQHAAPAAAATVAPTAAPSPPAELPAAPAAAAPAALPAAAPGPVPTPARSP